MLLLGMLLSAAGSCATILWIIAGVVLIIVGLLVGPGGVSIFSCGR